MASLNINSLIAHIEELRVFIDCTKIDILMINETKLDQHIKDNEIHLPGYELVRKDRIINGRNGGGVCIYLKSNLNFHIREDLNDNELEFLTVEVRNLRSKSFLVSSWYRPPKSSPDLFCRFERLIDKIDSNNLELYLLGDLNCNLLPNAFDENKNALLNVFDIYGLTQLIKEPTRITQTSQTLLDLCITNFPDKISKSGIIHVGISDHSLIYAIRKSNYMNIGSRNIIKRDLRHFNETCFLNDLNQINWNEVSSFDDPDQMWVVWRDNLMNVIDKHAPLRRKRIGKKRSQWITPEVMSMMHKRDFLSKKAKQTNTEIAWKLYRDARNLTNNIIKQSKRNYFKSNLDSVGNNPKKTWKIINELSYRQNNRSSRVSEIKVDNTTLTAPNDIAEAFNLHFTKVGENLAKEMIDSTTDPISYLDPTDQVFSFKEIELYQVRLLLKKINTKKAAGLDNIPCNLLKIAADAVSPSLVCIFNQSIATGIFPSNWKMAKVSPIFKQGNKSDVNNYRPISIISVVGKIFEKIISDQFSDYLNANNLLTTHQSGFRALHSTMTTLLETTNSWSVNIDNGFINGVIFIDLKKAFDTIDHEIIMRKLAHYGANQNVLKWFNSYLTNRNQRCFVNNHLSASQPISCGVPQGSILGPLLFLLYINDLPNCLNEGIPRMYADDTNISYCGSNLDDLEQKMNLELINLSNWLNANKLSLNIAKTEFMIIGSRQRLLTQDDVDINISVEGKQINRVNNTKSLGLRIDDSLCWDNHITDISKKISSGINALKRISLFMSKNTVMKVYNGLIEPHFNYCSSVWDGLSCKLSNKLQKLQNRAARVITKSSYETSTDLMLEKLNWDRLSTIRKNHKATLMFKILSNQTPEYLQELFVPRIGTHNLRDSENKLWLPKPRTDYLKRSISYSGAFLWNSLPTELRSTTSLSAFKRGIKMLHSASDSHTAIM